MIFLELIGWLIFYFLISFPLWIHGNWKTIFDKKTRQYLKEEKRRHRSIQRNMETKREKVCTEYQPYKIDEKTYVVCNFLCDGDCMFKNLNK